MIECNCMIPVMNYGSSASYKAEPSPEQIATGVIPLDSLPAAWWNCMWSQTNTAVNQARQELGQLITEINNVLCNAGVCPQDVCTDQLYQSINKIRQTLGNATTAGAVKSSSQPSEVAIDQTTGMMSVNCLGNAASLTTTARTVVGAVNELKSTYDCCFTDTATAIGGKAPTSHVSDATTYGVGNADCYGHLKISDTYTCDLGCTGIAASQTAVACVYNCLTTVAAGVASLGNTAGCALGTASAGTAITAARSDHVHPTTGLVTACFDGNYYGIGGNGDYVTYIKAPQSGIIPYTSNANGCGYIGTSSWPFLQMHAKTFHGAFCGPASHVFNNYMNSNMSFYWSGQNGQPSWLWGSNDGTNNYVWNPANFSVNYANSAGSASAATNACSSCCSKRTQYVTSGSGYATTLAVNINSSGYGFVCFLVNGRQVCNCTIYLPVW